MEEKRKGSHWKFLARESVNRVMGKKKGFRHLPKKKGVGWRTEKKADSDRVGRKGREKRQKKE